MLALIGAMGGVIGFLCGRCKYRPPPADLRDVATQTEADEHVVSKGVGKAYKQTGKACCGATASHFTTARARTTGMREEGNASFSSLMPRAAPPPTEIDEKVVTAFARSTYVDALRMELRDKGLNTL